MANLENRTNRCDLERSNAGPGFVARFAEDSEELGVNIKQEPCDNRENGDCVKVSNDVTLGNFMIVKPDTGWKEELNTLCCEVCGDDYDLYCSKCPMLVRIFDTNIPNKIENRIKQTLPKDFFDIREISPGAIGVIALRTVPRGVTFGPFEGLVPTFVKNASKWKISEGKLNYLKNPKCLNWMQYIRYSDKLLLRNLKPFQYENQLFYESTRLIEEREELLVCFDNSNINDDNYIQLTAIKEKLQDVYACTYCCLGFNSATLLSKHNTVCQGKMDENASFRESPIVQCTFCKIHLPEKEYSERHLGRCCTRKTKLLTVRSGIIESDARRKKRNVPDDADLSDGAKKYGCSLCAYETTNKHHFTRHLYTHSETKRYQCPKCPYRSKTKYYIGDHLRRKHADRTSSSSASGYACPLCDERFKAVSLLQIHVRISHNDSRSYTCPNCQFRTSNKKLFFRHHRSAHAGARPYRCRSCPKRFACEKSLRSHVANLHVAANRTKRFKCPRCDRFETKYEASLRKHLLNVHSGVKRFRCGECSYATTYKLSLERHLCLHRNGIAVECECADCGEKFVSRTELSAHVRQQHKPPDNIYRCRKCEYRTSRRGDLKKHSVVHDHVKPHECAECGYRTKLKGNLKRHLATHRQMRPFQCDTCRRSFTEKVSLKRHQQALHPPADSALAKPFRCERCDFESRHRSSLYKHLTIVHSDTKRHECAKCPFKTNYKYVLTRHMYGHAARSGQP